MAGRASQFVVEGLASGTPNVRASLVVVEALIVVSVTTGHVRATQQTVEALVGAISHVHAGQVIVEVLISTQPLPPPPPPPAMQLPSLNRVFLEWSDDRGRSFGNPVGVSMGSLGAYITSIKWNRLGMGRDRIYRISWSTPTNTALQGAWIESEPSES